MYSLKSTDERNNAIDILKILSMVMVVLLHCKRSIGGTLVDLPIFLDN